MNVNLLPYAVFWGVLAIGRGIPDHLPEDRFRARKTIPSTWRAACSTDQVSLAHRLALIDRWGKSLTVVVALYGVALAAIYLYQVWNNVPTY